MRSRKINSANHGENIIQADKEAHPKVNFRYLVYETVGHAGGISELEFNGDKTWPLQEQGRTDAQSALNAGEGTHFELLDNWSKSEALKAEYPSFRNFL